MPHPEVELAVREFVRADSGESYRIVDNLGRGGNANVYLVKAHTGRHRGVLFALKLFREIADANRLARFRMEAEFLRNCDHPAVMRVYDEGEIPIEGSDPFSSFPYMIVEYLPKTLAVAARAGLITTEKLSCTLQLLSGLSYLRSLDPQAVHRDIKPQNIFLRGRACVLGDFGLMKLLDGGKSVDVKFLLESVGNRLPRFYPTPDLVSYCRGESELTVQSDVFQLGLVLVVLFGGYNPVQEPRKPLDKVRLGSLEIQCGSQSDTVKGILDRMLNFDPAQRPTADELLELWEGPFLEALDLSHRLEGRLF